VDEDDLEKVTKLGGENLCILSTDGDLHKAKIDYLIADTEDLIGRF